MQPYGFRSNDFYFRTIVDQNGNWVIRNIPPAIYNVECTATNCAKAWETKLPIDEARDDINMALQPSGTIVGEVITKHGKLPHQVYVEVVMPDDELDLALSAFATTTATKVEHPPAGNCKVRLVGSELEVCITVRDGKVIRAPNLSCNSTRYVLTKHRRQLNHPLLDPLANPSIVEL